MNAKRTCATNNKIHNYKHQLLFCLIWLIKWWCQNQEEEKKTIKTTVLTISNILWFFYHSAIFMVFVIKVHLHLKSEMQKKKRWNREKNEIFMIHKNGENCFHCYLKLFSGESTIIVNITNFFIDMKSMQCKHWNL